VVRASHKSVAEPRCNSASTSGQLDGSVDVTESDLLSCDVDVDYYRTMLGKVSMYRRKQREARFMLRALFMDEHDGSRDRAISTPRSSPNCSAHANIRAVSLGGLVGQGQPTRDRDHA
jgi:hypothetical protein